MATEHVKIFSDTLIIVNALKNNLSDNNIHSLIKNQSESARLAGFGSPMNSVELFILKEDLQKAQPIVDLYKEKINS